MSSQFKFKPDKIKYLSTIDTLDSSHKKIINSINKKRDDVPKKEKKIEKLKRELEILDSKNAEIFNYINIRTKIIDEINLLNDEIKKIENYEDELEYYEKTHEILFNYYDIIDGHKVVIDNINNNDINNINNNSCINNVIQHNIEFSEIEIENNPKNLIDKNKDLHSDIKTNNNVVKKDEWEIDGIEIFKKSNELTKLDLLNQMSKMKRKEKKTTRKRVKNVESLVRDNNNIFDYLEGKNQKNIVYDDNNINNTTNILNNPEIKEVSKYDRASLFEDYKIILEGYPTQKKINKPCINCGPLSYKILNYSEGIYVCLNCGEVEKCIIENEITNYKDPMVEKPTFPYKRKNHFCEWINTNINKSYCLNIYVTARQSKY
jgi:hypothetical protein